MHATHATTFTFPSPAELTMTRSFRAPAHAVFDAWTKPELLRRWFGPPGWALIGCDVDLKVNGRYRFVIQNAKGLEIVLSGAYLEIERPHRLVHTQSIDGCEGQGRHEAVCTMVLSEQFGITTYTSTVRYPSKEILDSVLQHGTTEQGMDVIFDKLAAILGSST